MKTNKIIRNLIIFVFAVSILFLCGVASSAQTLPEGEEAATESEGNQSEGNLFEDIYVAVGESSAEILSVLAFVGSLIVAFAYKKGLLPTVKNGIGAIGNAVVQLKDATDGYSKHQDELISRLSERLDAAEEILVGFAGTIDEVIKKTEDGSDAAEDRANMKALMSAQIDMLYDIFMTSSLPQYQKDAVSQRIREMKEVSALDEAGE